MKARLHQFAALAACCTLLLAGCGDKHEPTKPTVAPASAVAATPSPPGPGWQA